MLNIYKAGIEDIGDLIRLRIDFLSIEYGQLTHEDQALLGPRLQSYFERHLLLDDFIAIIAKKDDKIAAAAFLLLQEKPASPSFLSGITATLLNVITYPEYRRQRIATQVIDRIIDEAKQRNVANIDLMATDDGKPLYQKLGFLQPDYMAMRLKL